MTDVVGGGAAKLKKRIRDIERMLQKDIPAPVRVEHERQLKGLKMELTSTQQALRARDTARKYHMVRFFERKKAIRRLKQAKRAHDAAVAALGDRKEVKKLRKALRHAETDVAYVVLFPKEEKYILLYPNAKAEDAATQNAKAKKGAQMTELRRRELRKLAEQLIEGGTLPFLFDDVLAGKTIRVETTGYAWRGEEVDAPEGDAVEEDEFFES
jgi:hypothetical protein